MLLVGPCHQDFDAKKNENKKGNDVKKPAKPGLQWRKCLPTEPTSRSLLQKSKIIRVNSSRVLSDLILHGDYVDCSAG